MQVVSLFQRLYPALQNIADIHAGSGDVPFERSLVRNGFRFSALQCSSHRGRRGEISCLEFPSGCVRGDRLQPSLHRNHDHLDPPRTDVRGRLRHGAAPENVAGRSAQGACGAVRRFDLRVEIRQKHRRAARAGILMHRFRGAGLAPTGDGV